MTTEIRDHPQLAGDSEAPPSRPGVTVSPDREPTSGAPGAEVLEAELLVEEISIDGMCGVY